MRPIRNALNRSKRLRFARFVLPALICFSGFFTTVLLSKSLCAEEPCETFLRALREERLFDVAVDYLDEMANSPLAPLEFRERIPLHKVDVLLDEASLIRDESKIAERLKDIESILQTFIDSEPRPVLLADAQEQRARIFMVSAKRLLNKADSDRITAAQKEELQTEARSYLERAGAAYEDIRLRLRAELTKPLDMQDPNANGRRKLMRKKYVLVRYNSPRVKEQIADSYGPGHPRYTELLNAAVEENLDLQEKYRVSDFGVDGYIAAGRCYQKLGENQKALDNLEQVFSQGRSLASKKREAAVVAIDCWKSEEPYPALDVYSKLRVIAYAMPPEYGRTPNGIKIQMAFAEACQLLSEKIKADGGPQDGSERQRMVNMEREATKVMRTLIRIPGAHRKVAQEMLAKWGNNVAIDETPEATGPPKNFAEAQERAKSIQIAVSQLASELDAKEKLLANGDASQQASVENLRKRVNEKSDEAMGMLETALSMTNAETGDDDLSNIRYLQCANHYQRGDYFDAAIIGEFLLEKYPNNSGTQPASALVCKAYWNLYRESRKREGAEADRTFEKAQLTKYCEYTFKTYPGSRQAEQAGLLMTLLSLTEGDAVAAERYLANIPEDSAARASVELEVGVRLWQAYVIGRRKKINEDELLAMRSGAGKLLAGGVAALKPEGLTSFQARAALSLTELYLESGESDLAIEQLETARVAPLDLIKTKHPTSQDPKFRRSVYKTAIRAYLAKLRDGTDTLRWVEKSQGVLGALKAEAGDSPEAQKELSDIYLSLARELQQQFETLETNEQRSAFADGLESFLTSLSKSAEDKNLKLLTGSMLTKIGLGLKSYDLTEQSNRFFTQAISVYEELDPAKESNPRVKLEILLGRANSLRGRGKFEEAIKQFGDILSDPVNRVYTDIQVDAASTYTEWGLAKNDSNAFLRATQGGEKRETKSGKQANTIMGWVNLAKSARRENKESLVAEAIYNIAVCKFRYGVIKKRPDLQDGAIKEIERFREKVPSMGGPTWKQKLNELEAQLKRERGAP